MKKILEGLLYIVLSVGIIIGLVIWFDYLEFIETPRFLQPVLGFFGLQTEVVNQEEALIDLESPWVVERIRIEKEREAILSEAENLAQQESDLDARATELDARENSLEQTAISLEEQKKTLNQVLNRYEDKDAVIRQNSLTLQNMPPEDAVQILSNYDDQQLIDVLRMTDQISVESGRASIVPFWLSLLPPDRAAQVQRKMTVKPTIE